MHRQSVTFVGAWAWLFLAFSCSSDPQLGASGTGGVAGATTRGGTTAASGGTSDGGTSATDGGSSSGGSSAVGGSVATGGTPGCKGAGEPCTQAGDCCTGVCDPTSNICASSINQCLPAGSACGSAIECCSLGCSGGKCTACVADDQACSSAAACCSGRCLGGLCEALNLGCHTAGNPCTASTECCSHWCQGGTCQLGASWCIQVGDVCTRPGDCCSGDCTIASGAKLGTCAAPPSGATYCSDGVDGTICDGCNGCCSRLCTPYGPTGVKVCQPASGCRVNGDLCRHDSDCCGAAGTGLPGDGNVVCEIPAGKALGICRNPRSCNPQGNVCHFQDYACSISSARNDCCAAVGNSGVCQLDTLGVPRCNGLGDTCQLPGESCASADDCCDHVPCIPAPDGSGRLICMFPPDGGPVCEPPGGMCTIDADCCPGTICIRPLGSTQGVCGNVTPPPADAGPDAPPPPDAGPPDAPTPPPCAQYGQICSINADCCNGVPCYGGICQWAIPQ